MYRCYFLLLNNSNTSIEKKHLTISSFFILALFACFTSKIKRTTFNNPAFWIEYLSYLYSIIAKTRQPFYIRLVWHFTSWLGLHPIKPNKPKTGIGFNCRSLFLLCFVLCRWLMLIFVFDLVLKPKTIFQRTDWQHFLLAIMEKQSNDNKMKNSWLKGEATPSDSGKKREIFIFFLLLHFPTPRSRFLSVFSFIPIILFQLFHFIRYYFFFLNNINT